MKTTRAIVQPLTPTCPTCHDGIAPTEYTRTGSLTAIVRSSIVAYNEALAGNQYHPGYTEHEAMAWEMGRAEIEKVKRT